MEEEYEDAAVETPAEEAAPRDPAPTAPRAATGPARPAPAATSSGRSLWWWIGAAGVVVAAGGAIYLMSNRGKKARKQVAKAWKKVRGGIAIAVISGIVNKAAQKTTERVLR